MFYKNIKSIYTIKKNSIIYNIIYFYEINNKRITEYFFNDSSFHLS